MPEESNRCEWITLRQALAGFVAGARTTQSGLHIKPLHWHVACRLVVEGGFRPEEVTPRPPLLARRSGAAWVLEFDASKAEGGESIILGGLKTKQVDVAVVKDGVGPVIAVSIKGTLKAFRNLTNRMEEAVGDCTNLHIAYPGLVYGFLHVLKAARQGGKVGVADAALSRNGKATDAIRRYHDVLERLAGRQDLREEPSRYEAVALALVKPGPQSAGAILPGFPLPDSTLSLSRFFDTLYTQYDKRFVYAAPQLESRTARITWNPRSPALRDPRGRDCDARVNGS